MIVTEDPKGALDASSPEVTPSLDAAVDGAPGSISPYVADEEEDVPMGVPLDDGSPVSAAPGVPPQLAQQRSGGIGVNTMAEITSL